MEKTDYRYIQYEMNSNTQNLLFASKVDYNPNFLYSRIVQFLYQLTLINPNQEDFYNQVGDLKQQYQINLIFDSRTWSYQVEYQGIQFVFGLFASYFKDDKEKSFLFSKERLGKCHEKSIALFHTQNRLVTGYVRDIEYPQLKTLHSWIEQKIQNKWYVMDYVMNMVIEKELYDALMGVEQKNILTNCDCISTFQTTFLIPGKLYCLAGEEIAKEIQQKIKRM